MGARSIFEMASNPIVIGVDLGGTNLRVAAIDCSAEHLKRRPPPITAHRKQRVGSQRSPEDIALRIADLVKSIAAEAKCSNFPIHVGIGIAAMLRDANGMIANSPHLGWRDVAFGKQLKECLGPNYLLSVYNDLEAITYGEYQVGAGSKDDDVLVVFVGTGIGGGAIVGGSLLRGASYCAVEIGHLKVNLAADAPMCACGKRGCVEAYAGGADLLRKLRTDLANHPDSLILKLAGSSTATLVHLDQAAQKQDPYATGVINTVAPLLGLALSHAVTLLNPACLILGGGVLSRTPYYRDQALKTLRETATTASLQNLAIVDAALGDDAGIIGSALLAKHNKPASSLVP